MGWLSSQPHPAKHSTYTPRFYRSSADSCIIPLMSDTHERPTLSHGTKQQVASSNADQSRDFEVERKFRNRSYAKVVLGLSGLLGEAGLLLGSLFGRGGLEDPLVLLAIAGVAPACAGSAWLLEQGMKGLEESSPLPLPIRHRTVLGGRRENPKKATQRQLLEAIERNGEITPARAALQTSLTVKEAEQLLSDLAQRGHLDVRVEGSRLVYAL